MGERSFHATKEPYPIANDNEEWTRLDDMHNGINDFLGNRLSPAEVTFTPKKILEVGCGSGAWAIQAAKTYPDAEVIAVDISKITPRPLPSNMKFQLVNITEHIPFERETFDIVHLRFMTIHIRGFRAVLRKLAELVKPGGWLFVEDIEHNMKGYPGPEMAKFYKIYHSFTAPKDVEPMAGPLLESVLKDTALFSEVNSKKVSAPFSGKNEDPTLAHLGSVMKLSFSRAYRVLDPRLVEFGLTDEIRDGWYREANDPARDIYTDIYFTWSRKAE